MPIGLGLASSHGGPGFLRNVEEFETYYGRVKERAPVAPQAAAETPEVLESWPGRVNQNLATLSKILRDYGAELLIVIGGDQSEMFDPSNKPNLMIYTGESAWAYNTPPAADPQREGRG